MQIPEVDIAKSMELPIKLKLNNGMFNFNMFIRSTKKKIPM